MSDIKSPIIFCEKRFLFLFNFCENFPPSAKCRAQCGLAIFDNSTHIRVISHAFLHQCVPWVCVTLMSEFESNCYFLLRFDCSPWNSKKQFSQKKTKTILTEKSQHKTTNGLSKNFLKKACIWLQSCLFWLRFESFDCFSWTKYMLLFLLEKPALQPLDSRIFWRIRLSNIFSIFKLFTPNPPLSSRFPT